MGRKQTSKMIFIDTSQFILKFIWRCEGLKVNGQNNFGEGEYVREIAAPNYSIL